MCVGADKSKNKTEPRESQVVRLHGVTPVFLRTGYAAAGKHHPSTFTLHWIYNFGLLQCTYLWLPWWDTPFASYCDKIVSREPLINVRRRKLEIDLCLCPWLNHIFAFECGPKIKRMRHSPTVKATAIRKTLVLHIVRFPTTSTLLRFWGPG